MSAKKLGELMVEYYQTATGSTSWYLSDLEREFFAGKGYTSDMLGDSIKAYLQDQTGLTTDKIGDLWRQFLSDQGFNNSSIGDSLMEFYSGSGFPSSAPDTAVLTETDDYLIAENNNYLIQE